MHIAINQATTMPHAFEDEVAAYRDAGFESVEVWLHEKMEQYIAAHSAATVRRMLDDHGLGVVGVCFHFGVMLSTGAERQSNLEQFQSKLETCNTLGSPVLVVPTDFPEGEVAAADYEKAAEGLAEAADMAAAHEVNLAVEFIKGAKLIGTLRQALELVRTCGRDNVGVLLDTFHLCMGDSEVDDLDNVRDGDILLVHVNDVPALECDKSKIEDSDRVLPGNGVLPLEDIIARLQAKGYEGYYSLELFNEQLWKKDAVSIARTSYEHLLRYTKAC